MNAKSPSDKPAPADESRPKSPARQDDLAAALRENLRRRKAQAQARAAEAKPERDEPQKT